jgi:hypothetical protein
MPVTVATVVVVIVNEFGCDDTGRNHVGVRRVVMNPIQVWLL